MTDYSSLAFDMAYAGRSVAYYQFDRETIGTGVHSWTPGYFDYETMGLGPLLKDHESAERWIHNVSLGVLDTEELYRERVKNTFAYIDTNNCFRVVEAIEHMLSGDSAWIVHQAEDHVVRIKMSDLTSSSPSEFED